MSREFLAFLAGCILILSANEIAAQRFPLVGVLWLGLYVVHIIVNRTDTSTGASNEGK